MIKVSNLMIILPFEVIALLAPPRGYIENITILL